MLSSQHVACINPNPAQVPVFSSLLRDKLQFVIQVSDSTLSAGKDSFDLLQHWNVFQKNKETA